MKRLTSSFSVLGLFGLLVAGLLIAGCNDQSALTGPDSPSLSQHPAPQTAILAGSPFQTFSDASQFKFNNNQGRGYETVNTDKGKGVLLTKSNRKRASSLFLKEPVSLGVGGSFFTRFSFRLDNNIREDTDGQPGADGIMFVLHDDGEGNTVLAKEGGWLGYEDAGSSGIESSVGIEFDTWHNDRGEIDDANGNHVGINVDGDVESVTSKPVSPFLNNEKVWYAWVKYVGPTETLTVWVSQTPERSGEPLIRHSIDLTDYLGGTAEAYIGFTAATGASRSRHVIRSWQFSADRSSVASAPPSTN